MAARPVPRWGGQLNDSGSHLIDILLWVLEASPDTVFAMIDNLDIEVDVLTAMSIKFDTGALCNISIVGHAYGGVREAFSVWLEEGALHLARGNSIVKKRMGHQNLLTHLKCQNKPTRMSLLLNSFG